MENNNVIQFPVNRFGGDQLPTTEAEIKVDIAKLRESYFDQVSIELAGELFARIITHGFDVSEIECIKDCVLVVESIKSVLMKSAGLEYPLQATAEAISVIPDAFLDDDDDI